MPKRIPIVVAKRLAREQNCRQIILFAWDGERTHCVTYGRSIEDCAQAAEGGNKLKASLGWTESLAEEPSRVRRLKDHNKEMRYALEVAQRWLCNCVPSAELNGPKPLPLIANALSRK